MALFVDRSPEFRAELQRRLQVRMLKAMLHLEGAIKRELSVGQPVQRTKSGRLIGLNPSRPGKPPHVLTGRLRQSITARVEVLDDFIVGRVGSNVEYARALELGYAPRNLDPRPYLAPTFRREFNVIAEILRGQ